MSELSKPSASLNVSTIPKCNISEHWVDLIPPGWQSLICWDTRLVVACYLLVTLLTVSLPSGSRSLQKLWVWIAGQCQHPGVCWAGGSYSRLPAVQTCLKCGHGPRLQDHVDLSTGNIWQAPGHMTSFMTLQSQRGCPGCASTHSRCGMDRGEGNSSSVSGVSCF